jgi:hypothetical protein
MFNPSRFPTILDRRIDAYGRGDPGLRSGWRPIRRAADTDAG